MKNHRALKITGIIIGSLVLLIVAVIGIVCMRLGSAKKMLNASMTAASFIPWIIPGNMITR